MNISLSAHAAPGAHGATGKPGKGGDPLADFMALLDQLGVSIEGADAVTIPAGTAGTQDIAAKLLAKLTGKVTVASPGLAKGEASAEVKTDGEDAKDDTIATLADLVAQLDPNAAKGAEPKLDIATLIAAVRALATGTVKSDAPKPDSADTPSVAAPAAQASSIAALLARSARATGNAPAVPTSGDDVKSAFAELENLIGEKGTTAKSADQPVADKLDAKEQAKLNELLARLTASPKPGAAQPQASAPPTAATPQINPQLAAIAQAIQNGAKEDKSSGTTPDISATTATTSIFGVAPATPAHSGRIEAAPANAMPSTADELAAHHLDLTSDSQWLDTLARDIARAAQSDNLLRFQLNPEHLGSLKVELLNGSHGTSVKLTADTEAARAILVDAQPRLIAEARAQGLRISEAQVDLGGHGGGQRHMAEAPVVIRTAGGATLAEIEQDKPASGERYA